MFLVIGLFHSFPPHAQKPLDPLHTTAGLQVCVYTFESEWIVTGCGPSVTLKKSLLGSSLICSPDKVLEKWQSGRKR